MMASLQKISHLHLLNCLLLLIVQYVHQTESVLCGKVGESAQLNDTDKIYFADQAHGIHTVQINGTIISCYANGTIINTTATAGDSNQEERFPLGVKNDNKKVAPKLFLANVNECAEHNQTFCTKNDNYPTEYIRKMLRTFGDKFVDVFSTDLTTNDVEFRIDGLDEVYLCDSYEKVIYPTSGKRQDGTELYIFNTDNHKQGVRVSLCQRAGHACKMTDSFPNNYRSECKQEMVYRELLSLSPEGQPVKEHFEFPACCSCILHQLN